MTPYHDFGAEVWIKHIDFIYTGDQPAAGARDYRLHLGQDYTQTPHVMVLDGADEVNRQTLTVGRHHINVPCRYLAIGKNAEYTTLTDGFNEHNGLVRIEVTAQVANRDQELVRR
jgi:hypothetical protein